jgi:hypothetical protein
MGHPDLEYPAGTDRTCTFVYLWCLLWILELKGHTSLRCCHVALLIAMLSPCFPSSSRCLRYLLALHLFWCWASPTHGTVSSVFFPVSGRVGNLKSHSQVQPRYVAGSQRAADHHLTSTGTSLIVAGDGLSSRCTRRSAFPPLFLSETRHNHLYLKRHSMNV